MYDIKSLSFDEQNQKPNSAAITTTTTSTTTTAVTTTNTVTNPAAATTTLLAKHTNLKSGRLAAAHNNFTTNTKNPYTQHQHKHKQPHQQQQLLSNIALAQQNTCVSVISTAKIDCDSNALEHCNPAESTHMTLLSLRRRRLLQRQACLISILAAFVFGLALGVFMPMFGLANVFEPFSTAATTATTANAALPSINIGTADMQILPAATLPEHSSALNNLNSTKIVQRPPSDFPTIYEQHAEAILSRERGDGSSSTTAAIATADNPFSVAFIQEEQVELSAEEVFRNAFHLEQYKNSPDTMVVKKLDAIDGSIKEFHVQRLPDGRFRKGPERRLSKPSLTEQMLQVSNDNSGFVAESINFVPMAQRIMENARNQQNHGIIKSDIYWGDLVERALPKGFTANDAQKWNKYVASDGIVERLEPGCGRMQNRLVIFADGTRACARYRQNTDQIQGEIFSFFLGQLLNMSNLAPSAAAVIDVESRTWSSAVADITQAQWKQQRPVVLTRWLPDLEPAGIPQPFQPLERHLNKYDVWNITLGAAAEALKNAATTTNPTLAQTTYDKQKGLLKRLEAASNTRNDNQSIKHRAAPSPLPLPSPSTLTAQSTQLTDVAAAAVADADADVAAANETTTTTTSASSLMLRRLIELAQWSDLIVFDYLIANLDRVVNNLYNFQWNADIMAAPAHNLARQTNTQLLVFLDNESGLLHGYRLLKKYEAYHGLLLDNLCVFRQPTIEALRQLRSYGAGRRLREFFEQNANAQVRDVLPPLPDKSIKILVDRIDRVLGQVQKCRDLLADR
ncbi:extracellular serine/threonine protein kinase four-jointed [Teleopsis dalmanni]|uniref:extracellular serine/threonine protein kinase four-jointed n=1 Tax=Teleopsis dalmanni TaxID=139649 RepID=UPI0018CE0B31|nr:extracellular serine/threonine protein kinase four-jointed [Teleopsis dalmanni]